MAVLRKTMIPFKYTRLITIPLSIAFAVGNYWLWIKLSSVIGDWSILGLFLTLFGMIPGAFLLAFLEDWSHKLYKVYEINSSYDDVETIIQVYGEALEAAATLPPNLIDEIKLPYPKAIIKQAIIEGLKSSDDVEMKEQLKSGYIMLAEWWPDAKRTKQGQGISLKVLQEQAELKQELQRLGLW
ncbi:hypothetical protein FE810_03410 [Thalassotalea litorea]|uniref:Uncharacterized protein n=1 Tax=Thalassotalea litorea TaxID=2020715 RepID=A0A5R9IS77_9GAMM|nr:hypothetical protein [Thalassotalea litorea]TLU67343.1 hypothetical protein FE810_03410 [Thalassotalea litorea]